MPIEIPLSSCLVAGGLCSLAGMLPDLDSDSGVPVREVTALTAALVPALMIPRFEQLGMDREQFVLATAIVYLAVRFGLGGLFKGYTVHRGMWHSLPAAAIAGLVTFLLVVWRRVADSAVQVRRRGVGFPVPPGAGRDVERPGPAGTAADQAARHGAQAVDHAQPVGQCLDVRQAGGAGRPDLSAIPT